MDGGEGRVTVPDIYDIEMKIHIHKRTMKRRIIVNRSEIGRGSYNIHPAKSLTRDRPLLTISIFTCRVPCLVATLKKREDYAELPTGFHSSP